jgi:protein TonB
MKAKSHYRRRLQYKKVLELSLIVSLLLHIFLLQGYKRLTLKPVKKSIGMIQLDVIDVPMTRQKSQISTPRRPSVPIPSEDEELPADETIETEDWVLDENVLPPPPPVEQEDVFTFIPYDQPPAPIGGYRAIHEKLVYPELAKRAGIEGQVIISALIDEDGNVIRTRVLKSLGSNGCDEAAETAIRAVKWNPAMQRDKPVKVWVSIPVEFKLTVR